MNGKSFSPPNHRDFSATILFHCEKGAIGDISLAEIKPGGGGPEPPHTHQHDHLFVVNKGSCSIIIEGEIQELHTGENLRVPGTKRHSVWNKSSSPCAVIGINITPPPQKSQ